ncbi:MAG: flagellar basal-body MS-ring/collar protein FliF [Ilumatobacteraceae bacterium]
MPPNSTNSSLDKAKQLAIRLTPIQRIALGAVVVTIIAGGLILSRSTTSSAMAPLYTDLSAEDASSVVDELESAGVEYDLTDAGRTVLVPKAEVYDLRVSMAGKGLPTSNEGYALLDDQGITTSEFRQRIDYQRALEGELAKTLMALEGVQSATVHLALPDDSVFIDQPATPTASVLVAAKGLDGINSSEVESIVHLVASSVKDMKPADVTVIDANGSVLSAGGGAGGGSGTASSDRAKQVADYESRMTASILALLTKMTGPNKVAVKVTANLDLDQTQTTSENFEEISTGDGTGSTGQVMTQKSVSERYGGGATGSIDGSTGVLGADGAIGTDVDSATGVAAGDYAKEQSDTQYALDRTVEQKVIVPGTVTQLNVAVLVDEAAITDEQKVLIEEMVATAAGTSESRGDIVTVTRMPFDTETTKAADEMVAATEAAQSKAQLMSMVRTVAILLVIIVALILGYRSAKNARRVTTVPIQLGEITAAPRASLVSSLTQAMPIDASEPAPSNFSRPPDKDDFAMQELTMMADRKPQEVADVLRTWLAENKTGR